eukprot:TRINITY_DN3511_c0_g1_i9.p1 TRINITY_DN3511_c0_g1~~TRINITY_DN3511_c0_g1_i9.p1  ORF type:complete len:498 (-),score=91.73 TRINITY_DN3511_c0_g1_i9:361-1854(-)
MEPPKLRKTTIKKEKKSMGRPRKGTVAPKKKSAIKETSIEDVEPNIEEHKEEEPIVEERHASATAVNGQTTALGERRSVLTALPEDPLVIAKPDRMVDQCPAIFQQLLTMLHSLRTGCGEHLNVESHMHDEEEINEIEGEQETNIAISEPAKDKSKKSKKKMPAAKAKVPKPKEKKDISSTSSSSFNMADYTFISERPKRNLKTTDFKHLTANTTGLEFAEFKEYNKNPQPFSIYVSIEAYLLMTVHAHLCKTEVIGIIGGTVCEKGGRKEVTVLTSLPCENLKTNDDFHNVEMDPTSLNQNNEKLKEMSMEFLGWYHSHPVFDTTPSMIDKSTQSFFQNQWQPNPFLGFIIGPYGKTKKITKKGSERRIVDDFLFHVSNKQVYKMKYEWMPQSHIHCKTFDILNEMIETSKKNPNKVKLSDHWVKTKGETYKDKIIGCVESLLELNRELLGVESRPRLMLDNMGKGTHLACLTEEQVQSIVAKMDNCLEKLKQQTS